MICKKSDSRSAHIASDCLMAGGLAVLPTDTVYGFSGIVDLSTFSKHFKIEDRIRAVKGRSESKPFIELLASPQDICAYTDIAVPPSLLEKWPGALTIIVPVRKDAPFAASLPSVAFRCPGDAWLRSVIAACGAPVYSTSVNRSGRPVLDSVDAIAAEFGRELDLIVDDGDKKGALPSTIVSLMDGTVRLVRQGAVSI
ncbi:MAG TPA: translation factor Sua5 [Treponema sp.]|nr:translation factor Sua5 [Treponema sp.]